MTTRPLQLPSVPELGKLFCYEPETGELRWRIKPAKCILVGAVAGYRDKLGYRQVQIGFQRCLAHRIIWKLLTGKDPRIGLDHINGDPSDNRFENLRLASQGQNRANSRRAKSGLKGASFKAGKWEAGIKVNYKTIYLGRFETEHQAHEAYCAAARKYFGEFARVS